MGGAKFGPTVQPASAEASAGEHIRDRRCGRIAQCAVMRPGEASLLRRDIVPRPVWIVVSTEKPTRSSRASGWFGASTIFTGRRWTILVKLPVALFGGIGDERGARRRRQAVDHAVEIDVVGIEMDADMLAAAHVAQRQLAVIGLDIDLGRSGTTIISAAPGLDEIADLHAALVDACRRSAP